MGDWYFEVLKITFWACFAGSGLNLLEPPGTYFG